MPKTLKDFLEVYKPKSPDEQKFVDKHVVIKHKDRNGNGDDVFNGNTKYIKRKEERKGYDVGEDEKVYEEVDEVDESYQELMALKNNIARNEKKMKAIPGIHPEKKRLAIQIEKDTKRHKELFNKQMGKNEEVDIDAVLDEALDLLMSIDEKTLTPAEMKKREEVVKAIKRDDPKMDKSMAYAIATKTAKRVAEDVEEIEELSVGALKKYRTAARADAYDADDVDDERRFRKRAAGSNTAGKKIVRQGGKLKEDAEDLDESAKVADHLIKRYGDNVRKSHVRSAAGDFGVGYVALSHAVRKKLGVTRLEEEQIDELSAKKLSDYTAAASDARRHRDLPTKKLDNRYKGVMRAGDKMNKGFSKVHATEGTMPTADEPTDADKKTAQKVRDMMAKEKKPVKKETQIDELSKKTLGSYVNKAAFKIGDQGITAGLKIQNNEPAGKNLKKMGNRQKGIERAVGKLTKEDIINRAVEKYVPEEIKFTPEERLLKRLNGLSEAHVLTLMGLFEDLNKDNQNKMIETVETSEGINQILNFVLENRGN
jgi:hypothetical protein